MSVVSVATDDLRAALRSVVVHTGSAQLERMHRVRMAIGDQNVTVTATNGYSAALAIVSVLEHVDPELTDFDLTPTDVKKLLAIFDNASSRTSTVEGERTLRLEVSGARVIITDSSGLFEGDALELQRASFDRSFPDIGAEYARLRAAGIKGAADVRVNGRLLGLFDAAAKQYGAPLVLEPADEHEALLLSCGESFLGLLMPIKQDDEADAETIAWRLAAVESWQAAQRAKRDENGGEQA